MTTPTTRSSVDVDVGDLRTLTTSWAHSLRAQGKSPRTIDVYTDSARQFVDFCVEAGMPTEAARVTREHVEAYIADVLERSKPATASVRYRSLTRLFRWLEDEGDVRTSPMAKMSPPAVPEVPVAVISDGDLRALLRACAGTDFEARRDAALIRLFIDTGCRLGEVTNLSLDDIDLATSTAMVKGKGSRVRQITFGPKTTVALDRYVRLRNRERQYRHVDALWVGRRGAMTEGGVRQVIRRRAKLAGIGSIHPHQFRHTASHRWLAAGGSETDLMHLNGWKSRQMLSRYGASAAAQRAIEAHKRMGLSEQL